MEDQYGGLQQAELFGIPVLFSNGRIADSDVPAGLYRYDLRGSDYDPGRPVTIEKNVAVNLAGSVLSPIRIPYLDHGERLDLGSGLSFAGSRTKTIGEFRELWGSLESYPVAVEIMHNQVIQKNEGLVWAGHGGPLATHEDVYAVYQIRGEGVPYEFMGMDFLTGHGLSVKAVDYDLVYAGLLKEGMTLDTLYARFNTDRPDDFRGHSMSVSDVVVLNRGNELQACYVDSIGISPLPDFVRERAELSEAKELIDDFTFREYEGTSKADYSDPARVGLAYTTTEDGKYYVRAFVNLVSCRMEKYLNGDTGSGWEEVSRESFRSLRELIDLRLNDLDFASLTAVSGEERNRYERRLDFNCRKAIEAAIDTGYDYETCRLDRSCGRAVVDRFGPDRVERVLAVTVRLKDRDGRFSPETRAWAEKATRAYSDEEIRDTAGRSECEISSHPALLDGFIGFTRPYMDEARRAEKNEVGDDLEQFAVGLDLLAQSWDPYEYRDAVRYSEENINRIIDQVRSGETDDIRSWLNGITPDTGDESDVRLAGELLKLLDGIRPERTEKMEESGPSL
ncbi:MAG: YodL domain-containing protein [Oscillospiraceae bacterium]|nr:YodL domain-containing protein [Oscillospiraceae bacterium]